MPIKIPIEKKGHSLRKFVTLAQFVSDFSQ